MTRAEPGASATAARLRALGHRPMVAPLLAVRPIPAPEAGDDRVGALAFTSRNGVAALDAARAAAWRDLPVFAVGDATALTAQEAGFTRVRSAGGDLKALGALIAAHRAEIDGVVLHLGAREPAGELRAAGVRIRSVPVYEAVDLSPPSPEVWSELDAVLIHSPRAGRAFAGASADRPQASRLLAVCISEAAAAPVRGRVGELRVAAAPNEAALLARLGKPALPV